MKNTVFPHKFWRPFLDCMPPLFFRPQYVWFPVHLKGLLIPLWYETLVVNWQNWLFTLFHQSRSVLSPNPIKPLLKLGHGLIITSYCLTLIWLFIYPLIPMLIQLITVSKRNSWCCWTTLHPPSTPVDVLPILPEQLAIKLVVIGEATKGSCLCLS